METVTLLAQAAITGCLAAWTVTAVRDNWMHPALNLEAVAMVMRFDRMAEEYPEDFARIAHRKIDDPRLHRLTFRLIVACETTAAILLILGTLLMFMAAFGAVGITAAKAVAVAGTVAFASTWAGFVAGGNHFAYWYCHEGAQTTHMLLVSWGILATILLLVV
ncbi:MAG: DUF2165 family protein [Pseudomonadota bacterium]